jgi:AcrR family transcriptional regulator
MDSETGLRERKKARTRRLIQEAAWSLFSKRRFDGVTVAEIARAAEAEKPVFNYFPTKEDLVFGRLEAFDAQVARGGPHSEARRIGPRGLRPVRRPARAAPRGEEGRIVPAPHFGGRHLDGMNGAEAHDEEGDRDAGEKEQG